MADISTRNIRAGVALILAEVPGIGTVETDPLDGPNVYPRSLPKGSGGAYGPYWSIFVPQHEHDPNLIGYGSDTRRISRLYSVRIEGWGGLVGTADWATWEDLTERVCDRIEINPKLWTEQNLGSIGRVMQVRGETTIRRVSEDGAGPFRAHFAAVTAVLEGYKTLTR
jgi:hypothetical protein